MIERYTRPEMAAIWSLENKFRLWLEIEILACEAQSRLGLVPPEAVKVIREKASFSVKRIEELESKVEHDVIAFLTNVAENVGPESRFIHLGMTSSDILDTALAIQMKQAGEMLLRDLEGLAEAIKGRAVEHKYTVMIGRTHGVHAEPITFGLKMALWYDETRRNMERLERAIERISYGQISGAVGTFAHMDPFVERYVCEKLGLKPAPASSQILQRDRHAEYMTVLAIVAGSLEKFAVEIRGLQRTEILEVEEPFRKGQKGSSAMPHKRNPIICERIAGQARVIRANAMAALENMPLWHERDISHSSVERVIIPDSTILLDYMLDKFTKVVRGMNVYPENMKANLGRTGGLIFSQAVMLGLTRKGMTREEAYDVVQRNAMESWRTGRDFRELISNDGDVKRYLSEDEIENCFDLNAHLRNIDYIFERVGIK